MRYFLGVKKRQNTITFQPEPEVMAALDAAAKAMGGRGARTTIITDACRQMLPLLLRERAEAILRAEKNLRDGKPSARGKD